MWGYSKGHSRPMTYNNDEEKCGVTCIVTDRAICWIDVFCWGIILRLLFATFILHLCLCCSDVDLLEGIFSI